MLSTNAPRNSFCSANVLLVQDLTESRQVGQCCGRGGLQVEAPVGSQPERLATRLELAATVLDLEELLVDKLGVDRREAGKPRVMLGGSELRAARVLRAAVYSPKLLGGNP